MRRESMPTIAPIGCAYNVVADNTGKKFAFPDNKATGRLNDENDDIHSHEYSVHLYRPNTEFGIW